MGRGRGVVVERRLRADRPALGQRVDQRIDLPPRGDHGPDLEPSGHGHIAAGQGIRRVGHREQERTIGVEARRGHPVAARGGAPHQLGGVGVHREAVQVDERQAVPRGHGLGKLALSQRAAVDEHLGERAALVLGQMLGLVHSLGARQTQLDDHIREEARTGLADGGHDGAPADSGASEAASASARLAFGGGKGVLGRRGIVERPDAERQLEADRSGVCHARQHRLVAVDEPLRVLRGLAAHEHGGEHPVVHVPAVVGLAQRPSQGLGGVLDQELGHRVAELGPDAADALQPTGHQMREVGAAPAQRALAAKPLEHIGAIGKAGKGMSAAGIADQLREPLELGSRAHDLHLAGEQAGEDGDQVEVLRIEETKLGPRHAKAADVAAVAGLERGTDEALDTHLLERSGVGHGAVAHSELDPAGQSGERLPSGVHDPKQCLALLEHSEEDGHEGRHRALELFEHCLDRVGEAVMAPSGNQGRGTAEGGVHVAPIALPQCGL